MPSRSQPIFLTIGWSAEEKKILIEQARTAATERNGKPVDNLVGDWWRSVYGIAAEAVICELETGSREKALEVHPGGARKSDISWAEVVNVSWRNNYDRRSDATRKKGRPVPVAHWKTRKTFHGYRPILVTSHYRDTNDISLDGWIPSAFAEFYPEGNHNSEIKDPDMHSYWVPYRDICGWVDLSWTLSRSGNSRLINLLTST